MPQSSTRRMSSEPSTGRLYYKRQHAASTHTCMQTKPADHCSSTLPQWTFPLQCSDPSAPQVMKRSVVGCEKKNWTGGRTWGAIGCHTGTGVHIRTGGRIALRPQGMSSLRRHEAHVVGCQQRAGMRNHTKCTRKCNAAGLAVQMSCRRFKHTVHASLVAVCPLHYAQRAHHQMTSQNSPYGHH